MIDGRLIMDNNNNNKGTLIVFNPCNFMDDDDGDVTGRPLGDAIGVLPFVGLFAGRLVGLVSPVGDGPDTGFPVGAFGGSVNSEGDFVGLVVVGAMGGGVNMDAIPKFKHSVGTLGHLR